MFSITRVILKPNIRNLSRTFTKADPGISKRKKLLNPNEELEETDLDDLEADFMNVNKSHKQHVAEIHDMLEKEKYHIVKQKYFKEKYPNFLTWSDKEQIRYLHNTNPEEWSIERLSEGFPALPEIIKKILKSKWTKNSPKVRNHDLAVQKNWEMLKNGQIPSLPKELVDHLNKFTSRKLELTQLEVPNNKKVVEVHDKHISTEFSEIISSYEKLKNKNKTEQQTEGLRLNITANTDDTSTFLTVNKSKLNSKHSVTLHQLKNQIKNKAQKGKGLSEDEKLVMKTLVDTSENKNLVTLNPDDLVAGITENKYETSKGALIKKTERDYSHLIYPERIMIPKNKVKKGYTYKLNDCYYDYDGRFLYRVPGMG